MDADKPLGHRAVSRRGAPTASLSSKRTISKMAVSTSSRKRDSDIELLERRPLYDSYIAPSESTSPIMATENSAKQFADSWLGSQIKLRAKQAEKHAYNLRANFKSKKGFHVQVPKRMMLYTMLVFLVLPLILFMYKENHIHDHDPAFHTAKEGNHSDRYYYDLDHQHPSHPTSKGRNNKHKAGGKQQHNSLQQLLGGSIPVPLFPIGNGTDDNTQSRSRNPSGQIISGGSKNSLRKSARVSANEKAETVVEEESQSEKSGSKQVESEEIVPGASAATGPLSSNVKNTTAGSVPRTVTDSATTLQSTTPSDLETTESLPTAVVPDDPQPERYTRMPQKKLSNSTITPTTSLHNKTLPLPDHDEERRRQRHHKRRRRLNKNTTRTQ